MISLSGTASPAPSLDMARVKVIVAGEAGAGKTSFVQAVTGNPVKNPQWTVGCTVQMLIHPYKAATPQETPYFVELWDVGGSRAHQNSRNVFYESTHAIILVYDLTNRKSADCLPIWLNEICYAGEQKTNDTLSSPLASPSRNIPSSYDGEQNLGARCAVPILIVGSKLDLCPATNKTPVKQTTALSLETGADELHLDCRENIGAGSTNGLKLARFFDKVIESSHHTNSSYYHLESSRRRKLL